MIRTRFDATLLLLVCRGLARPPLFWISFHLSWSGGEALRASQQAGRFVSARGLHHWDGHQWDGPHLAAWSFQKPRLAPVLRPFLSHCGRLLCVRLHPARRHRHSFSVGGPGQLVPVAPMALESAT